MERSRRDFQERPHLQGKGVMSGDGGNRTHATFPPSPQCDLLTVSIPGVGDRALSKRQVYVLYCACINALEAALPIEPKSWRDDPARARTSGVKATADLAKNKRKKAVA